MIVAVLAAITEAISVLSRDDREGLPGDGARRVTGGDFAPETAIWPRRASCWVLREEGLLGGA
jgi:hypothetical protein